jgi:hypothetical protein
MSFAQAGIVVTRTLADDLHLNALVGKCFALLAPMDIPLSPLSLSLSQMDRVGEEQADAFAFGRRGPLR